MDEADRYLKERFGIVVNRPLVGKTHLDTRLLKQEGQTFHWLSVFAEPTPAGVKVTEEREREMGGVTLREVAEVLVTKEGIL